MLGGLTLEDPILLGSRSGWGMEESTKKSSKAFSGELGTMAGLLQPKPPGLSGFSDPLQLRTLLIMHQRGLANLFRVVPNFAETCPLLLPVGLVTN